MSDAIGDGLIGKYRVQRAVALQRPVPSGVELDVVHRRMREHACSKCLWCFTALTIQDIIWRQDAKATRALFSWENIANL